MIRCLCRLAVVVFVAGCATAVVQQIIPFSAQERQAFLTRARPPQAFGLTVYSTESGPVFAGAHRMHSGEKAIAEFAGPEDSTAPVIKLSARGERDYKALLDTSSRENWITAEAAQRMAIVALAGPNPYETQAAHVYDEVGGLAGYVNKVLIDELSVENAVFYMRAAHGPLGPPARWLEPPPSAVLGVSMLRSFSFVQVDFPQRSVLFSATTPFPTPPDGAVLATLPLRDVRGVLAVEGRMDGEPMTFVLDTGGDFELVMHDPPAPTVHRLSVGDLVFPPDINVASGMDLGLGQITYPRIGRKLLARYKVTFDFRGKRVHFERPAAE